MKLDKVVEVTKILHKSYAKALKDVKVGDILIFEITIKDVTFVARNGVYATYVDITNLRTENKGFMSMTQFANIFLKQYEYEELKPIKNIKQVKAENPYADVMTLDEFCNYNFSSYDGHGYFHDGDKETEVSVWNDELTYDDVRSRFPYICWYNK